MAVIRSATRLHPRRLTPLEKCEPGMYRDGCLCTTCKRARKIRKYQRDVWVARHPGQSKYRPAIGTQRRLLALQYLGYTQRELAAMVGTTQKTISILTLGRQEHVYAVTHDTVAKLFDRLGALPPPPPKGSSGRARAAKWAQRNPEAAPPMAWDDDQIDHPLGRPRTGRAGRRMSA